VRVPGLVEWPGLISNPRVTEVPCVTSDYMPTVLDVLSFNGVEPLKPTDGISLLPLIKGQMAKRAKPIAFESQKQLALSDNRYKIYSNDSGKTFEMYDLIEDPSETKNIAAEKPQLLAEMIKTLRAWQQSCDSSLDGKDYKNL